jgi:predicted CoA-substrate-specific enzyme activase
MQPTGARLQEAADAILRKTVDLAGIGRKDLAYCITTGYGRHLYDERNLQVTDLTATARGAAFLFPDTRTVLDIGGQTVKASRIDASRKVQTFRLNDKCASGTGMFLEKTVRYMGYDTDGIGGLLEAAEEAATISGVCTVFAESEVINHLSNGVPPANIMYGAVMSLTKRSAQLLKRIKVEPEVTLVGGILRWETLAREIRLELGLEEVNVAADDMPQFVAALGCAILGHVRLRMIAEGRTESAQQKVA